jgi:hypothetical protein
MLITQIAGTAIKLTFCKGNPAALSFLYARAARNETIGSQVSNVVAFRTSIRKLLEVSVQGSTCPRAYYNLRSICAERVGERANRRDVHPNLLGAAQVSTHPHPRVSSHLIGPSCDIPIGISRAPLSPVDAFGARRASGATGRATSSLGCQVRRAVLVNGADQCSRISEVEDLGFNRVKFGFFSCLSHPHRMNAKQARMFQSCFETMKSSAGENG